MTPLCVCCSELRDPADLHGDAGRRAAHFALLLRLLLLLQDQQGQAAPRVSPAIFVFYRHVRSTETSSKRNYSCPFEKTLVNLRMGCPPPLLPSISCDLGRAPRLYARPAAVRCCTLFCAVAIRVPALRCTGPRSVLYGSPLCAVRVPALCCTGPCSVLYGSPLCAVRVPALCCTGPRSVLYGSPLCAVRVPALFCRLQREEAKVEREREEREMKHKERKAERRQKYDEIRKKYGEYIRFRRKCCHVDRKCFRFSGST